MKLSKVMNQINSALNYPSIVFQDVSLFFDTAIAELNTTLHTSIPTVTEMIDAYKTNGLSYMPNLILLENRLDLIYPADDIVNGELFAIDPSRDQAVLKDRNYYFNPVLNKLYIIMDPEDPEQDRVFNNLLAYYISPMTGVPVNYKTITYGAHAYWQEYTPERDDECELATYLPDEWVLLWLIPYVCFKYTARDGGTAQTFAEELSEGFQQLQETYNVPDSVILSTVAGNLAYLNDVKENVNNLGIRVPTKAILPGMKHSRNTNAIFGSFYTRGGFYD